MHVVLVVGVEDGSPAAGHGLRPGDVIGKVGNEKVNQPNQVAKRISHAKDSGKKSVRLLVQREGSDHFVALGVAAS